MKLRLLIFLLLSAIRPLLAQPAAEISKYDVSWNTPSKNAGESMPCGGGDVGLNVWVENGDLLFYIARSGTFDENNTMLKLGRVRIKLSPSPLNGQQFEQKLSLRGGSVIVKAANGNLSSAIKIWVDVHRPVISVEIKSSKPVTATAAYESWRYKDRPVKGRENNQDSYKWEANVNVKTLKDSIRFAESGVEFYHHNLDTSVFDATVRQQGLSGIKQQLYNPLYRLTFGGRMTGERMKPGNTYTGTYRNTDFKGWTLQNIRPTKTTNLKIYLNTADSCTVEQWRTGLNKVIAEAAHNKASAWKATANWWKAYWYRSFININPTNADTSNVAWQAGRNYQLFRYMLGCNAYGHYPTKFNGGLFTVDPAYTDTAYRFTPDFRNWGGGTMTAQNQRLVYWPMLKNGDFDLMLPQFAFYLRLLKNAELRSKFYWGHNGACFVEQLENFGLPNRAEYGLKRPPNFDKGLEYNAWLEYEWDTVIEFCLMMLETERYNGSNIQTYIPFIESCLTFFDEHYQYLAKQRGNKALDGSGHLVLFPGSGGETYKMAYNSTSTIAALRTVLTRLLALPDGYLNNEQKQQWQQMLQRIPPLNYTEINGHKTIAPALTWQRINNTETTQLYPVFPWEIYGVGKPDLETALNTWKYDTLAIKFRSGKGWKQDNIFAARLGLTNEAAELTLFKLKNSGRRFPAFWGPGYDWVPDHNWGGSGMIGLQEMLLQTNDRKIYLFPAWPKDWNVHFKLHAPYNTTVEATLTNGKVTSLKVFPKEREKDVISAY
ncbi:DUF5703 domain-containing protein [Mucilaginibacter sp. RS28]|uniref:DUF5703 domain-containing protein n=1 Tax=Mucilaginibacter straminoryzae TaxID=2932774 RepID=A0A9X2B9Q5_9SPHI|nr:DUF5703 domain-containing protein [Mucilaginibacter straminoryzae]MCJ8210000.1 DUF5703 domain-containing protein [Mucilaginibacter straminoryzae]